MPAPRPALLPSLLLAACFADGGNGSSPTSDHASSTGPGGSTDDAAATGAPTTTQDPGTSGEPTTTGSTGPAASCDGASQCQVGAVELGEPCDSCGQLTRTCQPDCTWGPAVCEEQPATCAYWVLPQGATTWTRVAVDPDAEFAPSAAVRAAFPLAPDGRIYVLTDDSYHVLSTPDRAWIASGTRTSLFPELAALPLHHGDAFTQIGATDSGVTLVAGEQFFAYSHVLGTSDFDLVKQDVCCGDDWSKPDSPDFHLVRDSWGELENLEGWAVGDVQALCGLDTPTPYEGYSVSITDDQVHLQEVGHCFDFFPASPYVDFTPFTYPGAPRSQQVGGAAWLGGLWIFRE